MCCSRKIHSVLAQSFHKQGRVGGDDSEVVVVEDPGGFLMDRLVDAQNRSREGISLAKTFVRFELDLIGAQQEFVDSCLHQIWEFFESDHGPLTYQCVKLQIL